MIRLAFGPSYVVNFFWFAVFIVLFLGWDGMLGIAGAKVQLNVVVFSYQTQGVFFYNLQSFTTFYVEGFTSRANAMPVMSGLYLDPMRFFSRLSKLSARCSSSIDEVA